MSTDTWQSSSWGFLFFISDGALYSISNLCAEILISNWLMCPRMQPCSHGQRHSIIISLFDCGWKARCIFIQGIQAQDLSTSATSWFNTNWLIDMWKTDLKCPGHSLWIPHHWCIFPSRQGHSSWWWGVNAFICLCKAPQSLMSMNMSKSNLTCGRMQRHYIQHTVGHSLCIA